MTEATTKDSGEICQRCGEGGFDRRTLWMACLYDMSELDVPLRQCAIFGTFQEFSGIDSSGVWPMPNFKPVPRANDRVHAFFTLRVCKRCRGEWMQAIQRWFNAGQARGKTRHDADCTIYATLEGTDDPRAGMCTCGYAHDLEWEDEERAEREKYSREKWEEIHNELREDASGER
jgi:hypothetical protein